MDKQAYIRLTKLPLCLRCTSILLGIDDHLSMVPEDMQSRISQKLLGKNVMETCQTSAYCICCLNAMSPSNLSQLAERIRNECGAKQTKDIRLEITFPALLDAFRVASRAIICSDFHKSVAFPIFEDLLESVLKYSLEKEYNISVSTTASWTVKITGCLGHQLALSQKLVPGFAPRKAKRKLYEIVEPNSHVELISRSNVDFIMKEWKTYSVKDIDILSQRLVNFNQSIISDQNISTYQSYYDIQIYHVPIYLYGRYCKYARDVPQSPWLLYDEDEGASKPPCQNTDESKDIKNDNGEQADASSKMNQKGRDSIEEIIGYIVKNIIGSEQTVVKLHACGREDIDVRCLGNGRPFALEVLQATRSPSDADVEEILQSINKKEDKNNYGDISLVQLQLSTVEMWESMQKEAEEKDKQYSCVVYVSKSISKADLIGLEVLSRRDMDDSAIPRSCLQIIQRTPLRVLHRRSLMDRPRYIYTIQTTYLNPHFFIMSLATSAGAYVKEFVHGDLGRTTPSVSSFFDCQAEILQLDVTWLYDSFMMDFPIPFPQHVGEEKIGDSNLCTDQQHQDLLSQYTDWSVQEKTNMRRLSREDLHMTRFPVYCKRERSNEDLVAEQIESNVVIQL